MGAEDPSTAFPAEPQSSVGAGHRSWDAGRLVGGRRLDAEGVGQSNEKAEQRRVVRSLGDLLIGPAHVAQALDLLVGDAVGRSGDGAHEFQQQPLARRQAGGVEVTVAECFGHPLELCALQLQEPGVRAESIPALVERRYVGRDHLVLRPGERAVAEVHSRGGLDGLIVLRMGATIPIGLCAFAFAYSSARGPWACDSSTILMRAINAVTVCRSKGVGGPYTGPSQDQRGTGSAAGTLESDGA